MALVVKDRVQETTTTTGTGTVTLAGAVTGFQSFSVIGDGNTTYYSITGGAQWEIGIGTYTASGTTLSRDTVLESSNSGSLVDFSAGTKTVFCTYPAERSMYVDGTTITPATTATLPVVSGGTGSNTATFSGANITSLNASSVSSGTLGATYGGTGQASLTANNVILGNGTSAVQFVAPGTASNVLTSNGTTWVSQAAGGGAQDFDLVLNYSFSGQSLSSFDVTNIPTTAGYYVMTGSVFLPASTQQINMSLRMSINNGSSFYSGFNYLQDANGSSAPNVFTPLNRSNSYQGKITFFFFISQSGNTGGSADTLTMEGQATAWAPADCGGAAGVFTSRAITFRGSTSPVNAFRFYINTGAATYSDANIRFYKLATS